MGTMLTSCHAMMYISYLLQKLGFTGKTYATEPTMHFGR